MASIISMLKSLSDKSLLFRQQNEFRATFRVAAARLTYVEICGSESAQLAAATCEALPTALRGEAGTNQHHSTGQQHHLDSASEQLVACFSTAH